VEAATHIEAPIPESSCTTRTLQRALFVQGGLVRLAGGLGVSVPDLVLWLQGKKMAPHAVFLKALDLAFPLEPSAPVYSVNQLAHKYAKSK